MAYSRNHSFLAYKPGMSDIVNSEKGATLYQIPRGDPGCATDPSLRNFPENQQKMRPTNKVTDQCARQTSESQAGKFLHCLDCAECADWARSRCLPCAMLFERKDLQGSMEG